MFHFKAWVSSTAIGFRSAVSGTIRISCRTETLPGGDQARLGHDKGLIEQNIYNSHHGNPSRVSCKFPLVHGHQEGICASNTSVGSVTVFFPEIWRVTLLVCWFPMIFQVQIKYAWLYNLKNPAVKVWHKNQTIEPLKPRQSSQNWLLLSTPLKQ